MDILQLNEKKEKQSYIDLLEEQIRQASKKLIERIYLEEVQLFLYRIASLVDGNGHRLVVRNGWSKERRVQTSSGNIVVKLPRVDEWKSRQKFVSKILSPFARKTPTVEALVASLYLAGVSSNKFQEALSSIFGERSKGFSPSTIIRLTRQWSKELEQWRKRDLTDKEYVYVWADGIHVKSRLGGEKTCLLVMIGVGVDGKKEILAIEPGMREST